MSLGNILQNPQVGCLFIDFSDGARLRVNGRASIHEAGPLPGHGSPAAGASCSSTIDKSYPTVPHTFPDWCRQPVPATPE
jgi:hypothetical protein